MLFSRLKYFNLFINDYIELWFILPPFNLSYLTGFKKWAPIISFVYSYYFGVFFSNGCLHVHPDDMKKIDDILKLDLNVTVNKNPYGKLPYPYPCQGILSIQQIDGFLEF